MKENSARKDNINAGLKILDDFANLYGNTVGMTENNYKKIRFAIDNILLDYKRVLKENEELKHKYDEALSDVIAGVDLDNTYIPVQKIKDKIEELENDIEDYTFYKLTSKDIRKTVITNLQDLLEKKGE